SVRRSAGKGSDWKTAGRSAWGPPKVGALGIGAIAARQALAQARAGTSRGDLLATCLRGSHTPLYASPQQARGEFPDVRDDVHALGVLWYQLLIADLGAGPPTGIDWVDELHQAGLSAEGGGRPGGPGGAASPPRGPAAAAERADRLAALQPSAPRPPPASRETTTPQPPPPPPRPFIVPHEPREPAPLVVCAQGTGHY